MRDVRLEEKRENKELDTPNPTLPTGELDKGECEVSVKGYYLFETAKAVKVSVERPFSKNMDVYLPKSQIHIKRLNRLYVEIYMKKWLKRQVFG